MNRKSIFSNTKQLSLQINGSNHKTCAEGYRFGFNGKEKDNETYGDGNIYDYGFRVYDPRKAKFLSVDPLTKSYPWYTPYQFAGNTPIMAIDLDGLEEFIIVSQQYKTARGKTVVYRVDFEYIKPEDRADGAKNDGSFLSLKGLNKSHLNVKPTYFNKGFLNTQFNSKNPNTKFDLDALSDESYMLAKKSHNSGKVGGYDFPGLILPLKDDNGVKKEQIQENLEYSKGRLDAFDVIAARLVFDKDSKVNVSGSATPSETNIGRTQGTLNKENNKILAEMRAEAGKEFLLEYIQKNYGVEIEPSRIQTHSVVGSDPNKASDRNVTFSVSPTQKVN